MLYTYSCTHDCHRFVEHCFFDGLLVPVLARDSPVLPPPCSSIGRLALGTIYLSLIIALCMAFLVVECMLNQ